MLMFVHRPVQSGIFLIQERDSAFRKVLLKPVSSIDWSRPELAALPKRTAHKDCVVTHQETHFSR